MGTGVGVAVATGVGDAVGDAVIPGPAVTSGVGADVGVAVGTSVGSTVTAGSFVGISTGSSVGSSVILSAGAGVTLKAVPGSFVYTAASVLSGTGVAVGTGLTWLGLRHPVKTSTNVSIITNIILVIFFISTARIIFLFILLKLNMFYFSIWQFRSKDASCEHPFVERTVLK